MPVFIKPANHSLERDRAIRGVLNYLFGVSYLAVKSFRGNQARPLKLTFGLYRMMLPPDVIENATLRGQEYAWPPDSFIETLHRAARHSLACAGGQFQFRIADGPTCEMYWIDIDTGSRNSSESWDDYVNRSIQEVETKFKKLMQKTDFQKEAESWNFSEEKERDPSFNPLDHLCFVAYFESESN